MAERIQVHSRRFSPFVFLAVIFAVFVVAVAIAAGYLYNENRKLKAQLPQSKQEQEKELKAVLPPLKKLMDVPDENPSIATVIDKEKIKNQPFFAKAENGDKLVIFESSRKAVLFRPSSGKIVNFDVFVVNPSANTQPQANVSGQPQPTGTPVRIAIYNGTGQAGAASATEKKLKEAVPNLNITTGDAKERNYEKTLVIDVSKKIANGANEVAQFLGGTVSELPQGETPPDVDILVIIGKT